MHYFWLFAALATMAGTWKIFEKTGVVPGWASIVPIYNILQLLFITGKPIWWIALFFIPLVNLLVWGWTCIELSSRFGKSAAYGLGLTFLPFIFFPMLGYGYDRYRN